MLNIFYIWYNNVIVSFNQFQIAVLFEVDSKAAWPSSIDLGFLSNGWSVRRGWQWIKMMMTLTKLWWLWSSWWREGWHENNEEEDHLRESRRPRIQKPAEKMIETMGRKRRDIVAKEPKDFRGFELISVETIVVGTTLCLLRCWLQACMATSMKGTIMVKIIHMSIIFT